MADHIFISYSRMDQAFVNRLAEDLRSRKLNTWIDSSIDYGTRWPEVIRRAVRTCAAFVVVMTPAAANSSWVGREISEAELREKEIYPILLVGQPFFRLGELQYADLRDGSMPKAEFYNELTALAYIGSAATAPDGKIPSDDGADGAKVIELAKAALALQPSMARAHNLLGAGYLILNQPTQALEAFDAAIRLEPRRGFFHENRADALARLERIPEMVSAATQAIACNPESSMAWVTRAIALERLGRDKEALADLTRALAIEDGPENGFRYAMRGVVLKKLGQWKLAKDDLDRALRIDSTLAEMVRPHMAIVEQHIAQR